MNLLRTKNERPNNANNYEEAIPVVQKYETITKPKKKGILSVVYRQDIILTPSWRWSLTCRKQPSDLQSILMNYFLYDRDLVHEKVKRLKNLTGLWKSLSRLKSANLQCYFKIKLVKILDKYPKLKQSLLESNFFKDYANTIKQKCKESGSEFK